MLRLKQTEQYLAACGNLSGYDFVTAMPSLVFIVTGWKSNGKEKQAGQIREKRIFISNRPTGQSGNRRNHTDKSRNIGTGCSHWVDYKLSISFILYIKYSDRPVRRWKGARQLRIRCGKERQPPCHWFGDVWYRYFGEFHLHRLRFKENAHTLLKNAAAVKAFGGEARIEKMKTIDRLLMKAVTKGKRDSLKLSYENMDCFIREAGENNKTGRLISHGCL